MKRIIAICAVVLFGFGLKAQTNTGILQILLDVSQLSGTCKLAGVDTVYIHSGLGWSNPDSIWESIVGDWGLDDGKGEMTKVGSDSFSICFNVVDYYTNLADADSNHGGTGSGPMPAGQTPYNIGMVFRTASCPVSTTTGKPECTDAHTGKDENCLNIYALGINDPVNMVVEDASGNPFPAVTVQYINACADSTTSGVHSIGMAISNIRTYPVPFTSSVRIEFALNNGTASKVEIFDMLGQKLTDLNDVIKTGSNSLAWNGRDAVGNVMPAGVYIYKISNNSQTYTGKVIKQ